jgi:tripartite-type tricarboxylate transporter receptor subunit TctC
VANTPEVRDALLSQGAEPSNFTPEQVGAYVKNEAVKWAKVVKDAGVKLE